MCHKELPSDYILFGKIDLQKNKTQFWAIQSMALFISAVMIVAGWFIEKLNINGNAEDFIALGVLVISYIAYIILHEATHGLVMYLSVRAKLNFGFKGWAAYAGSTAYFDKKHYILISLAPLVLWGIIFAVLTVFFHSGVWFWVIWLLQTGNIAGAAGDLFCTYKMFKCPKDILVNDTGLSMTVYRKMTAEEIAERQGGLSETINGENSGD